MNLVRFSTLAVAAFFAPCAWSQLATSSIVSDIETAPPTSGPASSTPLVFGSLGSSVLAYSGGNLASDGLWRHIPGTADAVRLVTTAAGQIPQSYVELPNGVGLFALASPSNTLWRTDGTAAGTYPISGQSGTNPVQFLRGPVKFGNRAYFLGESPSTQAGVWSTDGSAGGTTLDYDLTIGTELVTPSHLFVAGNRLFVSIAPLVGNTRLYAIPSPGATPTLVLSLGTGDGLFDAIEFQGNLWFTWSDPTAGKELWKSDGTAAGTGRVIDIDPGSGDSGIRFIAADATRLWFRAWQAGTGYELWASDGTTTTLVKDVNPGVGDGVFYGLGALTAAGKLVFAGTGPQNVLRPYVSDGTTAGTFMLGSITADLDTITSMGGNVYFTGTTGPTAYTLYRSDGTSVGTNPILNNSIGFYSPVAVGNLLWFANRDPVNGTELWSSDGTPAGTGLAVELAPEPLTQSSAPGEFLRHGDTLYFAATTQAFGRELWATDGTSAGTHQVVDIAAGSASGSPILGAALGDRIIFSGQDPGTGKEPWVTNGTAGGTFRLADLAPGIAYSSPTAFRQLGSVVVFAAAPDQTFKRLYRTDGTVAGTFVISPPGMVVDGIAFAGAATVGGKVVFPAYFTGEGTELWVSDGTASGTQRIVEFNPGPTSALLSDFVRLGNFVYFAASDPSVGKELYRTDGTAAGTTLVKDIAPGLSWSNPIGMFALGDRLIFGANDWDTGTELWTSDGTAAGTQLLVDIVPGDSSNHSSPEILGRVGDRVYFLAFASVTATKKSLWWTDGTAAGTTQVPTPPLWNFEYIVSEAFGAWGGTNDVVIEAKSPATGSELWRVSAAGGFPKQLTDNGVGVGSSAPGPVVELRGRLLFVADDPAYGRELFAIDLLQNGAFGAESFGNGCSKIYAAAAEHSGSGAIGQSLTLEVDGPVPGATAVAFLSIGAATTPLGNGCTLYLANPIYLAALPTNAVGDAAITGPIAANPGLVGIGFVTQWFLTEPAGPLSGQYGVSSALEVVIGP